MPIFVPMTKWECWTETISIYVNGREANSSTDLATAPSTTIYQIATKRQSKWNITPFRWCKKATICSKTQPLPASNWIPSAFCHFFLAYYSAKWYYQNFFLVGNSITSLMVIPLPRRGNWITKPKNFLVIPLPTAKERKHRKNRRKTERFCPFRATISGYYQLGATLTLCPELSSFGLSARGLCKEAITSRHALQGQKRPST